MLDPQAIENILLELGALEVSDCSRENAIRSTCPFHGGNNPSSLRVSLTDGSYYCFACGAMGRLDSDDVVAKEEIYQAIEKDDLSEMCEAILDEFRLDYSNECLRIQNRELLSKHQVGVVTNGENVGKIVFPYRDITGKLHGFKIREKRNFKMENYLSVADVFFMENKLIPFGPVILVEGEWDALNLTNLGFYNVMALGGSNANYRRCCKLRAFTEELWLALDNDDAGRKGEEEIARKLSGDVDVYSIPYSGEDPGVLTHNAPFWDAIKNKKRYV